MPVGQHIRLGAFLFSTGHHVAGWRHPSSLASGGVDLDHYIALARSAEAARFDLLFLEDGLGIRSPDLETASRTARAVHFEPLTLLAALATQTRKIGLVATVSTSYSHPYSVARVFTSLDHLSQGRTAWNLVTSTSDQEAANFGLQQQVSHDTRYARADEFAEIVQKLWDSWDADALIANKASGQFFKEGSLRAIDHRGTHFSVKGPLNIPKSPQGRPVLVQAGSSEAGRTLAAKYAEIVFTAAQTLEEGRRFYQDLKHRAKAFGRSSEDLLIMPGLLPIVGKTQSEARSKFEALQDLITPEVGLAMLSQHLGIPYESLARLPLDSRLPDSLVETQGNQSRQQLLLELAKRENLTIEQLYKRIAGARGHAQIVGTPAEIADFMEERFHQDAADGFNIMPPTLPGGLNDFIELVLPELRRRGLVRLEYESSTLRGNLGLK